MSNKPLKSLERVAGIEPAYSAWKAVKTFNEFKGPFHSRILATAYFPFLNETAIASGSSRRLTAIRRHFTRGQA